MTPSLPTLPNDSLNRQPISTGGPAEIPTTEQIAAFEEAFRAANERFLATALAEDGMPISAGWRGPEAQPKPPQSVDRTDAPNRDEIALR